MINLYVEPRIILTWDEFRKQKQPFSVALDGYVSDKPLFDSSGPYANFNHHEFVDRLSTRSTAGQVHIAVKMGLFQTFQKNGIPEMNIYVNDCDQDVCVATWFLRNYQRITGTNSEPLLTKLASVTDLVDTTGGMYPLNPNSRILRQRAWIFEPYSQARLTARVPAMDEYEMKNVIDVVCSRIDKYSVGQGEEISIDTRYEKIGGGKGWIMVRELGIDARIQLMYEGHTAFVSVRDNGNGRFTYTLAKASQFVPFPIKELYLILTEAEGDDSKWAGADTIGGSSREKGSKLKPEELEKIINSVLAQSKG